jgi:hypothetical protein
MKNLSNINARKDDPPHRFRMNWQPIVTAPFDRDLELAVFDSAGGLHPLVFPCRRVLHGWVEAGTTVPVNVRPTHWRKWGYTASPLSSRLPS